MVISELIKGQKVIVQLLMDDQTIEFHSRVADRAMDGVYVEPYLLNGQPLEFNFESNNKVVCNLFADDLTEEKRVSWRNIDLTTHVVGENTLYLLKTKVFNSVANSDDRRRYDRIVVKKQGHLQEEKTSELLEIIVFDVSDTGISFYAPRDYNPPTNKFTILFSDKAGEEFFTMRVGCEVVRSKTAVGMSFYGCRIVGDNKEYLWYVYKKHLDRKKKLE